MAASLKQAKGYYGTPPYSKEDFMEDFLDAGFAEFEQSFVANQTLMSKQAWEDVLAARKDYFERGIDPRLSGSIRPEIAESWIRSRELGLDPDSKTLWAPLDEKGYRRLCSRNKLLIEAAGPILSSIDNLDLANDYIFEVIEPSGVSLVQGGNLNLHEFVAAKSTFNEATMGTCAHALCLRHKKPFLLVGAEHYSVALHNLSGIAAPILDADGRILACLLLTQPIVGEPWHPEFIHMRDHTLGLLLSLASTIEFKLQLRTAQSLLFTAEGQANDARIAKERVHHILDAAVDVNKEGLIVIDKRGVVQHANPEAIYMLKTPFDNLSGKPIGEILGLPLMEHLGKDPGFRKNIPVALGNENYELQILAVANDDEKDYDGFVLTLRKAKKDALGARRTSVGDSATITFDDILGSSAAILETVALSKRYAMTDENVLLVGESGTGKECFAQAIHNYSKPNGPFMSINCAAIPSRLVESELFGYEAGSFTGADKVGRPGKIELSDGGTLFLDEIGDMPLDLQATLLRVIENKRVMRIGGKNYRQIDFRVMAATNRDLPGMVESGAFREDLLYRLSVLSISLPPLRDRPEDKLLFAHYYLNECKRKNGVGPGGFSPPTLEIIESFEWPGNVRQIKNSITSAFYSATGTQIMPEDLPTRVTSAYLTGTVIPAIAAAEGQLAGFGIGEDLRLQTLEERAIRIALQRVGNNIPQAAELLGISKATLYRKLEKLSIPN